MEKPRELYSFAHTTARDGRWNIDVSRELIEDGWHRLNLGEPLTDESARKWIDDNAIDLADLAHAKVRRGGAVGPNILLEASDWADRLSGQR